MGFRVARTIATALALAVPAAMGAGSPASAQQPAAPTAAQAPVAQVQAPPPNQPARAELFQLSSSCTAPDATVSSTAPLANLAKVLQQTLTVRVLAVGSSSSVGMGAMATRRRYTDEIEEILERSIKGLDLIFTHRGVSGELASATSERIKQEVGLLNPDLVLWQVGTNDALSRVPVEDFEATLDAAVAWVKDHGKDIALVGLQYTKRLSKDPHYGAIKEAVARVSARHNVLLVRRYETLQFMAAARGEQAKLEQNDFMLSELGYRCMAEHIARALVVNVFARRATDAKATGLAAVAPAAPAAAAAEPKP